MSSIIPIPSSRVSDRLVSLRLVEQMQGQQQDLLKLETQISSGQALTLPSDDPAAAQRGIELKQLIAQQSVFQSNVSSNQAILATTDSALSSVSGLINNIKGVGLGASSATANQDQRTAAASQVNQAISQLVNIGNQQFNGRYLFAGSQTTVQPFTLQGSYVQFNGNQNALSSYSNASQLFSTNVSANSVFGTLSPGVQGSTDLNPVVTAGTPLADLRSGQGISKGSVAVSDGSHLSIVDLSGAATLGDVAKMLEAHPPAGRQVTVDITANGLSISLDSAGGGNLSIGEVGDGTTASQLGLRQSAVIGTGPLVGADLNPELTLTTPLNNVLGVQASARLSFGGVNNDLTIQAVQPGTNLNGVAVSFVNNPAINAGQETVSYDSVNKTLTFQVAAGQTTANDVMRALNNDPAAGAVFQAQLVTEDTSTPSLAGSGAIDPTLTALTTGGSGTAFDTSGLQIMSGGQTYTVDLSGAKSIQDVLNAVNSSGSGAVASINAAGTGIDIRSQLSGADFSIGENGGTTAAQLGLRSLTTATELSDFNHGIGVHAIGNGTTDFSILRPDGSQVDVSLTGAKTLGDVLNLINNDPNNQNPANKITAALSSVGNGITLQTASGAASFQVSQVNGSQAAADLGLVPAGATLSDPATVSGGVATISGSDPNPGEVAGVFNTMVRLQQALSSNDSVGIQRALTMLDQDSSRLSLAESELGVRQQGLQAVQDSLQTNSTTLSAQLSNNLDVDMTKAISDLTAKQTAFQAALQTTAIISKLTLLNFL